MSKMYPLKTDSSFIKHVYRPTIGDKTASRREYQSESQERPEVWKKLV